jgi:2-phosphoglycerate kinase
MTAQEIIEKVKALNLPKDSYCVFGSCPMAVAGIREANDIDLLVSKEVLAELRQRGWKEVYKAADDVPVASDVFEAHDHWNFSSYSPTLEYLLSTATVVDSVPFASLEEVKKWKTASDKPKHQEDVRLIDEYLRTDSRKQSKKIFIYGVPGAGKTTYSLQLKKQLSIPLVEADYLRQVFAQKDKTKEEDPFVYVGTTEAFRQFGDLNRENVIQGLKAVRKSMALYVHKELSKFSGRSIIEGAFLDPEMLAKLGKLVLVVTSDESKHRVQYFQHREQNLTTIENFKAARMLQEHLQTEALTYDVEILENDFAPIS